MNIKSITYLLAILVIVLFASTDQLAWSLVRASGFVATGLLVTSMVVGIMSSTKAAKQQLHAADLFQIHRTTGYLTLLAIAVHTLGLLADSYINFSLSDVLIPGISSYRPVAVAVGIVAAYLAIIVTFSFDLKRWLGTRAWRMLHMLNYPLLAMAIYHGVVAGTDTGSIGAQLFYYGSGFLVLAATIFRVLSPKKQPAFRRKIPS